MVDTDNMCSRTAEIKDRSTKGVWIQKYDKQLCLAINQNTYITFVIINDEP